MQPSLPPDPFALLTGSEYRPAATRELQVCGAPAELVWLPSRQTRRDAPTAAPPAFRAAAAERILREEALWRGGGCVLTPNLHPLATRELLLWCEAPVREPDPQTLALALALEEAVDGAVMVNSVGAAASNPRAHAHLAGETLEFLEALPRATAERGGLPAMSDVEVLELMPPFPGFSIGVRGSAPARAAALHNLLEHRSATAFNIVSQRGVSWFFPRSTVEIPAPHFPTALGCSELWGRWFFAEQEPFERATADDLQTALGLTSWPRRDPS